MNEIDPKVFQWMRPPMVCLCRHVSAERLRSEIRHGATTFEQLQERTSCSTVCGTCEGRVREILRTEIEAMRRS
ncbi:MAG: (2Fe-2S)-binding protein [Leptonema illini]|jgi:bacterioferritin-associated ferredoxin|uniref:Bacterioferritin-associated ferredoxin n=1 Tax=Leptonema illini TaxID=183 RepID=A0A833H538_9LEPT|nr:MAG: (2Fe-2S)-binding protein [Leptonema illini]PKL32723.1 MAG: (2Fe-2S)-binding protein [Spirochaetae bacterium HGW-Spirochaetae-10]